MHSIQQNANVIVMLYTILSLVSEHFIAWISTSYRLGPYFIFNLTIFLSIFVLEIQGPNDKTTLATFFKINCLKVTHCVITRVFD